MTRKHEYAPMTDAPVMRGMQANLGNSIICGDCVDKLKHIPAESADLIYLDPPFFSGRNYEVIWKDGAEVRSFEDTNFYKKVCGNDECGRDFPQNYLFCPQCGASVDDAKDVRMNDIEAYIGWLRARLQECYRVLKQTGSIYVHLDWHAVHYVKVMMDDIFGYGNFQNEIVWYYRGRGMQKNRYQRKHDTLLFYSKSKKFIFNGDEVLVPYDPKHVSRYNKSDADGLRYADIKNKNGTRSKVYLKSGLVPNDVWEMPFIHGKESLGYPTQKPEALLERIIKASSNPGDVVLDPFCGCGTSISVAQKLGRRWIGIDVSLTSCKTMTDRLRGNGYSIGYTDIIDAPQTADELRTMEPFEFQNLVVTQLGGRQTVRKSGDRGIDGFTFVGDPIQVKRSDKVGANVVRAFTQDVRDVDKTHGIIVAFSYSSGAYEEIDHINAKYGIDIELKTVADLVD